MYAGKNVLLIAGGGTLGTYTAKELLRLGCNVDVICPEDKVSDHPNLTFHQNYATDDVLTDLFQKKHYHGIVNFIHYKTLESYRQVHPLLIANTDHLIFLSSYRVYADEQHPITESAPQLLNVSQDQVFLDTEDYAIPKAKCENYLRGECAGQPWTIVRPVISFSQKRLDLLMYSKHVVLEHAQENRELLMPDSVKHLTAGLDWAGNSGKLIANLLFKPETIGQAYTVSSGVNQTWEQIAQTYTKLTGVQIRWCSEAEFVAANPALETKGKFTWNYDRKFNRVVDPTKIINATGLCKTDFATIEEGLRQELLLLDFCPLPDRK